MASYAPVALRFAMHKVNRSGEPFALCVCILLPVRDKEGTTPWDTPLLLFDTPHYFGATCMSSLPTYTIIFCI